MGSTRKAAIALALAGALVPFRAATAASATPALNILTGAVANSCATPGCATTVEGTAIAGLGHVGSDVSAGASTAATFHGVLNRDSSGALVAAIRVDAIVVGGGTAAPHNDLHEDIRYYECTENTVFSWHFDFCETETTWWWTYNGAPVSDPQKYHDYGVLVYCDDTLVFTSTDAADPVAT